MKGEEVKRHFLALLASDEEVRSAVSSITGKGAPEQNALIEQQLAAANSALDQAKTEFTRLQGEYHALEAKNDSNERRLSEANSALDQAKAELTRLQGEYRTLEAKNDSNERRLSEANSALDQAKTELTRLQGEYRTLEAKNDSNEQQLSEANSALVQARGETKTIHAELSRQEADYKQQLTAAKSALKRAQDEKAAAVTEKLQAAEAMEALKQQYAPLGEAEAAYDRYAALPQSIKTAMAGFVRGDSLLAFIVSGARDSKLDAYWEFCRTEVQKSGGLQYAEPIAGLFAFFFARLNSVTENPLYELNTPGLGARFNGESMIVSNSSASKDGAVERVILPGYTGRTSHKIVKKAVVALKG